MSVKISLRYLMTSKRTLNIDSEAVGFGSASAVRYFAETWDFASCASEV